MFTFQIYCKLIVSHIKSTTEAVSVQLTIQHSHELCQCCKEGRVSTMYLFYSDSMKVVNNLNPNEANSKCSCSTIHLMEVEPPSLRIVHSIRAVQFILV